jgi:putative PIN family toxin of toxin-antitoxin system
MLRLVLDTNVWLDLLVFNDPGVRAIRVAVDEGRAEILIDAACEAELERVLTYEFGRHRIPADAAAQCRALCKRIGAALSEADLARLPRCADPDDQKFIEAAAAAGADILVTKDRSLLEMRRRLPFRVLAPDACAAL